MKAVTPLCAAGMLVLGAALSVAGQAQPSAQSSTSSADEITVSGCVQREADYRKTQDAGRGGVAGTGVGTGNEFVLEVNTVPGLTPSCSSPLAFFGCRAKRSSERRWTAALRL